MIAACAACGWKARASQTAAKQSGDRELPRPAPIDTPTTNTNSHHGDRITPLWKNQLGRVWDVRVWTVLGRDVLPRGTVLFCPSDDFTRVALLAALNVRNRGPLSCPQCRAKRTRSTHSEFFAF